MRLKEDGDLTLNFSHPDQVDLYDNTEPENYVGENLDFVDHKTELDFWIYDSDWGLCGNVSVFGYLMTDGSVEWSLDEKFAYVIDDQVYFFDHEPTHADILRTQVQHHSSPRLNNND